MPVSYTTWFSLTMRGLILEQKKNVFPCKEQALGMVNKTNAAILFLFPLNCSMLTFLEPEGRFELGHPGPSGSPVVPARPATERDK